MKAHKQLAPPTLTHPFYTYHLTVVVEGVRYHAQHSLSTIEYESAPHIAEFVEQRLWQNIMATIEQELRKELA